MGQIRPNFNLIRKNICGYGNDKSAMEIERRTIYQITLDGDYEFLDEALEYCLKRGFAVQYVWVKDIEKYGVKAKQYKVLAQKEKLWL